MAFASNTFTGSHFVFAAEYVQYKCNNSVEQCNVNAPSNVTFDTQFDQQCYARVPLDEAATCFEVNQSTLVPCNDWVYENPDSFVAEFQLGCQEWKRTLVGTMHSFGNMIGLLFIGPLSDSIGRKKAIIMTGVLGGALGLVRSFATNYWLYVVLEMIEAAVGDICSPAFMFKRKKPLILSFLSAALFFLLQPFLPSDLTWLSILFFLSGKFMASIFFNITYLVTSELFPTHTRNSMHALCSSLGRIGSILAPQTPLLLSYWVGLPSILFGSASLIAAIVTLFVPDTADDSLPDTVHQAEFVGSNERRKEQEVELI
ncbi:unnamed protein product [Plutella xylostella]|uniref:(diamondback moth) hypothetical protein n=1 Tax=Plutella xylostella TaxID=51655 RepID=A0A8S4G502_PLUXY|nr:unnamed protein product [Plutella xylostella]